MPARNEIFERYNFFKRNQNKGESLDAYITTLLKLSETCAFGDLRESLVCDRLVYGIRDDQVREKLLGKRELDLDKCIEILKSSKLTDYQGKEISVDESQTNYVRRDRQKLNEGLRNKGSGNVKHTKTKAKNDIKRQKDISPTSDEIKDCQFCGRSHQNEKEMCPAWGKRCRVCKKVGHFWKMCRSSKVHQVSQDRQDVEYLHINSSGKNSPQHQAFGTFKVNQVKNVSFQID